ncbi:hypothetical protein SAMN05216326_1114 [Nitrosomonas marina]|uniref:Uncharacterized protein n=1 Tax=Nitrosomonas marina TaxID=917 RepID=A0A1I0BJF6_9PROT|nr:hypothetical protein SAMN05216326_1114 [Nitrosomonas marina]
MNGFYLLFHADGILQNTKDEQDAYSKWFRLLLIMNG